MLFRHKHDWGDPRMEILTIRDILSASGQSRDCWVKAAITERCDGCSATRRTLLSADYVVEGRQINKPVTTPTPPPAKVGPAYHRKRCANGHAYTHANTIVNNDGTYRCRRCYDNWIARRREARQQAAKRNAR